MFHIDSKTNTMTVVQGDTGIFDLTINNYLFVPGDKVLFILKKNLQDRRPILEVATENFDYGTAKFILSGEDTNLKPGEYVYGVKCILLDGREDTVIMPSKFVILEGVSDE